jgi:hypothetical protein
MTWSSVADSAGPTERFTPVQKEKERLAFVHIAISVRVKGTILIRCVLAQMLQDICTVGQTYAFDYKQCRCISDSKFPFAYLKSRNNYEHQHLILSHVSSVVFLIIIIIHNFYKWRLNLHRCLLKTKKHLTECGEIQYTHLTVYYVEKMLF